MRTSNDWYGKPSPYLPKMAVNCSDGVLEFRFSAEKKAHCDETLASGAFVEGLWEKDVAEFFVSAAPDKRYQEINISPTGAWWSALFSDYRVREREVEMDVEIETERGEKLWSVRFRVPVIQLIPWANSERDSWRFGPTAILHDPEPNFFCWSEPLEVEPDFHLAQLRRPFQG